ncbi:Triosephosphate isomerase [Pseudocohnilembus persalinus]|uniref:Triosephosphate isomerase n=1 Tax=Pseudocohnilembus persalinus TaxID=266149 RepID=A0A0V0Q919_PSEPJ|nr:Triosephosphate isomerase [Pseudocohnilembus persalinus]|eukprot:KRW98733.1 Triosephosphate isomerase [Pseudocohnilembus persalinus]
MSVRRLFVGGNWKCNNTYQQTKDIVNNVYNKLTFDTCKVQVIAAPVFLHIPYVKEQLTTPVEVAAQNTSLTQYGAYTGEIAPNHVKDFGIHWTILGHSERRSYYGEDSQIVAKKTKLALDTGLHVIACVGESLQDRESGQTNKVVESQLAPLKEILSEQQWKNVVVAYEPVWAIGTGKVASPEQAQEVHEFIRSYLGKISKQVANETRIIYGGSVSEKNSDDLIQKKDIDGFLVGGAALKPGFIDIVNSCNQ